MANLLLNLPGPALALLAGDDRKRLISYLNRWGAYPELLRALDHWLALQPQLVLLREARARVLLEVGQAQTALALLDALDAERGSSQVRRGLRLRALIALQQYEQARVLNAPQLQVAETQLIGWLNEGDICRASADLEAADTAYRAAQALDPHSMAPARRLARLALDRQAADEARGYLEAALLQEPDRQPSIEDLRLLQECARLQHDQPAVESLAAQLAAREQQERDELLALLKLDSANAAEPAPVAGLHERRSEGVAAPAAALPPEAYQTLRNQFGLQDFRPNQAQVIAAALGGRSTLAIMPTGAGKSLTYQLPSLLLPNATVVISPLIALMKDQLDGLPELVRVRATAINSSLSGAEVAERLRGIGDGRYRLVYVAPERLRQRPFLHALRRAGVSLFVVDEAHCVSMWGLSFRPDYLFIARALAELGRPPLLAVTATASIETQDEIRANLGELQVISAPVFRPNLRFEVLPAGNRDAKAEAVVQLSKQITGPIIVYARSRAACEELAAHLRQAGVAASHYHAQVADRAAVQDAFMRGSTRVLVATVAFGMGIDKRDIRGIIHYNLPQSLEAYYQEAGRAGRDGLPARCILLYSASDKSQLTTWLRETAISRDDLRALYRSLRSAIGARRYGIINLEQLQHALQRNDDESFARVGLSMLERVGLLRRHFDLPRQAQVSLRLANGDPLLQELATRLELLPGERSELDLLELAAELQHDPSALEGQLLEWSSAGLLRYEGSARDALLEFLPAASDVGERIDTLLADYQARQERRVEAMGEYARAAACRHSTIARHFGQRLARCVDACDNCAPQSAPALKLSSTAARPVPKRSLRPDNAPPDAWVVLEGLQNLPFPMGRSGLARVLKGAGGTVTEDRCPQYAALAHLPLTQIEDLIERLLDDGYLERDEQDKYRLLRLSISGRRARHDQSRLPEWAIPERVV